MYPTQVRSFGLGVCNACSRFGALLSPFLTVDLVENGHPSIAEGTLALCCAIAAILTWLLPIETKARSLLVNYAVARLRCFCLILLLEQMQLTHKAAWSMYCVVWCTGMKTEMALAHEQGS